MKKINDDFSKKLTLVFETIVLVSVVLSIILSMLLVAYLRISDITFTSLLNKVFQ